MRSNILRLAAIILLGLTGAIHPSIAQQGGTVPVEYAAVADSILSRALLAGRAHPLLASLTGSVGARLSGSPAAAKAVEWARGVMQKEALDRVRLQPVTVPHWERGTVAEARILTTAPGESGRMRVLALGGSVATPAAGVTAEVVEVRSLKEAEALGDRGRGKIVFFNRPMDKTLPSTFDAYGGAVDQRVGGAVAAAKVGAVAVLVRSMTTATDTFPHTGTMHYDDGEPKIPAAAISTVDADRLSQLCATGRSTRVMLRMDPRTLPDAESANVIGELTGTDKPGEVIVIGGHLDSWDVGQGAHDDGAGVVQAIEALRLLKSLGLRPRRTIRAVLFMNEENGLRGATAYAKEAEGSAERHIAAIESDRGGFAPRGFDVDGDDAQVERIGSWAKLFERMGADRIRKGGSGADVGPLKAHGALTIGLIPESHRYFDYHHSANDTFDKVNERELELGAAAMALLAWVISEEGM